jgi:hypothetical protein
VNTLRLAPLAAIALLACGHESAETRVQLSVTAEGTARDMLAVGDTLYTLTRADVGFGPVYFCAEQGATPALCEVARAQMLETVTLDGLAAGRGELGRLHATSGDIRSCFYDYGISWLLTESTAQARPGAPDGHSAVLEGRATRQGASLRFEVHIDIEPSQAGAAAVDGQATEFAISAHGAQLSVRLDPYRWLEGIDSDALFALDEDGDGSVEITPADQAYQAIAQGMTTGAPLTFDRRDE